MNIDSMTIIELKAMAFDIQQDIQRLNQNFQIIGQRLEAKMKEEEPAPKPAKK